MQKHTVKDRSGRNSAPADRRKMPPSSGGRSPQRNAPRQSGSGQAVRNAPMPQSRNGIKRPKGSLSSRSVLFISIGAVAAVLLLCMLVSFFVGVQSIEVSGTDLSTPEEIIAASGIKEGSGYFNYNTSKTEKKILDSIPCVSEVEIDRSVFGKVTINVTEKDSLWYTELFGEYYVLSESLEVIRHLDNKNELAGKYAVRLDFPKVESAVLGRRIEISDDGRDCSFIDGFLAEVRESELYKEGRLDYICIETKFEIFAVSDLKYKIFLGKYSEATVKLDTARLTLADESFSGEEKWYLDVSSLPKVITRPDEALDFSDLGP